MDSAFEDFEAALQSSDMALAAEKAKECLENIENTPLNIAITGESGSGKSSLVNAMRGLDNNHKDAAPTGCVETTMEATPYAHPEHPNVKIWDLPGVGTTKFTAEKYLEEVELEKFDFFIIVSSDRFRENDANLAKAIKRQRKNFYFVRTKIDHNMRDEKDDRKQDFDEEKSLTRIRDNCLKELQGLEMESPQVFLVSSRNLQLYDFEALWETFTDELPEHKRKMLLDAFPNTSLKIINEKIKSLRARIKFYVFKSAAGAAVPIPGISGMLDISIVRDFVKVCKSSLGLNDDSLLRLSKVTNVPLDELKAELKSPLAGKIVSLDLLRRMCTMSAVYITATVVEEGLRFIPFIGIPVAMAISSASTDKTLHYLLNTLAEDAQRVFVRALGLTSSV